MGNGGSGSTASHIAGDLMKGCNMGKSVVMCLSDNMATFSAWANDISYSRVFSEQLFKIAAKDDLVIVISASGCSANVVGAVWAARRIGAISIALIGAEYGGGPAGQEADHIIMVPSDNTQQIEDCHLIIGHMIALALRESPPS